MERQKSTSGGISVGSSSILVIFVVLALTAFAALSLTTAGSDLRLTQRVARATQEYYAADGKAVEAANELRRAYELSRREQFPEKAQALGWTINGMFANLTIPMQDNTTLEVTADFSKLPISFTRWQVVNEADWVEQDSFALWGGEEMGLAGAVPSDMAALADGPLPPVPGLNPAVSPSNAGVTLSGQNAPGEVGVAENTDEPNTDVPTYVDDAANTPAESTSADYTVTHIPSSEGLQGKE